MNNLKQLQEEKREEIIKKIIELSIPKDRTSLGCNQFLIEETLVKELEDFIDSKLEQTYKQAQKDLKQGLKEYEATFDLLWDRMREWEEEWRKENPRERKLTSPDAMMLIEWKISRNIIRSIK